MFPIIFLTGAPASGKGTQCTKLLDYFKDSRYFSVGDILRAETSNPESKYHDYIKSLIDAGNIVPPEVSVTLMKEKIESIKDGCKILFIDGFPRSLEQMDAFHKIIGLPSLVFNFVTDPDVIKQRVEARVKEMITKGETPRKDDNPDVVMNRIKVYNEVIKPVIESYTTNFPDLLKTVNCNRDIDTIFDEVKGYVEKIIQKRE